MNTVAKRNLFRTPGAVCRLVCGALLAAAASGCADRQQGYPHLEVSRPGSAVEKEGRCRRASPG